MVAPLVSAPIRRLLAACLLTAGIAACAGNEPEPAREPVYRARPVPTAPVRPAVPPAPPPPGFCASLKAAIGSEVADYAPLQGDGPNLATAPDSPFRGLASCRVQTPEDGALRAAYQCRSPAFSQGAATAVDRLFADLEEAIDACLVAGDDSGRAWRRAPDLGFATLERQALWADQASWPRSVVTLKVEPDSVAVRPDVRVQVEISRASGRSLW